MMWREANASLPFQVTLNNVTYNSTTNDTCYNLDENVFFGTFHKANLAKSNLSFSRSVDFAPVICPTGKSFLASFLIKTINNFVVL